MSNIDKLKPGKYAILFRNNWDGEGDTYETFAILDAEGIWRDEDGDELLEYQGDEVLKAWPLDDGRDVLALLDELEAAEKRIAEMEVLAISKRPYQMENGKWGCSVCHKRHHEHAVDAALCCVAGTAKGE